MYVGVLVILYQSPMKDDDSFSQFIPFVQNVRQMEKMNVLVVHALLGKKGKTILIKLIYILTSDVLEHKWRASLKTILFLYE